jgi:hypothetical protein
LIGDLAPVMQNLLDAAIETPGPGLPIHPTIGAVTVGLVSSSTAVHRDKMASPRDRYDCFEALPVGLLDNNRTIRREVCHHGHGARMRTIHVFVETVTASRGWCACAHHDDERPMPDAIRIGYFPAGPKSDPARP